MLVVQFPEGGNHAQRRRRQVRRAWAWIICGTLITAGLIVAMAGLPRTWWPGCALLVTEAWWLWAVLTDPIMGEKLPRLPKK